MNIGNGCFAYVPQAVTKNTAALKEFSKGLLPLRLKRGSGVADAELAINLNWTHVDEIRRGLCGLFESICPAGAPAPPKLPAAMVHAIANLAEFVALAGTNLPRKRKDAIENVPEFDSPTFLACQLKGLATGNALLDARATVEAIDVQVAQRVAWDRVPVARRMALGLEPITEFFPENLFRDALTDLKVLGLIDHNQLQLTPLAEALLRAAGVQRNQ